MTKNKQNLIIASSIAVWICTWLLIAILIGNPLLLAYTIALPLVGAGVFGMIYGILSDYRT